ncbi:replication-relaxation family protein [Mycobacteroides abscessus]|uniref:replication-relaxation family protein n=1 Tax=Mycobacteroides abscessus TaxID=36809 RepID=UPI0005DF85AC|nr:replication-relaxation family protein [Mycobacteroides abscessus]CPV74866.1 Uncharacterised protein [Mycobacteroides abscessus]
MTGRHRAPDATDHAQHGDPIADPVGWSNAPAVTSENGPIGARNNGAQAGTTSRRPRSKQRVRSSDIDDLRIQLSERDIAILLSVAEHHFMTTGQIEAIHFANHAPEVGARLARRSLARLRRHRLLGCLERRIGGVRAGSAGLVHHLDRTGYRLLADNADRRARGFREPSTRFIDHRLAVAETHVTLIRADQKRDIELAECAIEPASWRRFTGTGGSRLAVKPDLYIETATATDSDLVTAWFLEIDLGTEHIPTLLKKCRDYEAYRRSGIEQDRHGSFPLVIWSMAHHDPAKAHRRRQALAEAIAADRNLSDVLFRIVAPEQLLPLIQQGAAR